MSNDKTLVGVYGSLKTGESNNGLLIGSSLLGTGLTVHNNYALLDFGGYPGAIPGTSKLKVEVWSVTSQVLQRLDRLESHPHFYKREEVPVQLDTGEIVVAYIYLLTKPDTYSLPKVKEINGISTWSKYAK